MKRALCLEFGLVRSTYRFTVAALIAISTLACQINLRGQDFPNSSDHPLLKRVKGSEIFFSSKSEFDRLKLALSKLEWSGAEMALKPYESTTVEGQRLTNYYMIPEGISVFEAFRSYEQELKEQGFEILFSGQGDEVETPSYGNQIAQEILKMTGTYGTPEEKAQWPFQQNDEKTASYIAARKRDESGETYASLYIVANTHQNWLGKLPVGRTLVRLDVCEVKPREQRMEFVTSEKMAGEISLNGRIALYGILFDFNSSKIQTASAATLNEIAKLLQEKPELQILVVGHTDAVGSFDFNKKLSQERADSVKTALVERGVLANRLFPVGVSFAAPVATNKTEEGRAQNRRVELVDLAAGKF